VQFLIDTATDKPAELYRIGRWLAEQFETVGASANRDAVADSALDAPLPAEFAPTPTVADVVSDADPEIEIDAEGIVHAVTTAVELPAAPPPPPPVVSAATAPAASTVAPTTVSIPPATPAPPGPTVPAELDSRGMPWDARIHASNRSKTIKNEWKRKRGVDESLVAAVEAQNKPKNVEPPIYQGTTVNLIPIASAVAPSISAIPPPAMSGAQAETSLFGRMAPPAVSSHSIPAAPGYHAPAMTAPPPPPPPVVGPSSTVSTPTPVPTSALPATIDFRGLMQKIQAASAAGKLTPDQVNAALAGVGLRPEEMAQLINNAPLIASVNAAVDACL
jgi:hypothetical protein